VLLVHPSLPPGFARAIDVEGEHVRLTLRPERGALLDPLHPGWLGLAVRGEVRGLEAMVGGVDRRARVTEVAIRDGALCADVRVDSAAAPLDEPSEAAFVRLSGAASWVFRAAS
jgi:hypothetical protein